MTKIEQMERYIQLTPMESFDRYEMMMDELFELYELASSHLTYEAFSLAFRFGRAKGYRAAKREEKR